MKLAYVVLCFKNFRQIRRLIDRLNDEHSHFVLVVDSTAPRKEFDDFVQSLSGYSSVTFALRSIINWGTSSIPLAFRDGIELLLKSGLQFDYVFLMSGQDYPLVKPNQIRKILEGVDGCSLVMHEAFPVKRWEPLGMGRLFSWNFCVNRKLYQFPKWAPAKRPWVRWLYKFINLVVPRRGTFPLGMTPYGGSAHCTLSRDAAEHVVEFSRKYPEYDQRFRFTFASDEVYFQTMLANSNFKTKLIDDDSRYLRWPTADAASPAVLTEADLPDILASNAMFARKFDIEVDEKVLDEIDRHVDRLHLHSV